MNISFGYQKELFWISEIVILDIHNNYFRYQKSKCQFFGLGISEKNPNTVTISDISNNYF